MLWLYIVLPLIVMFQHTVYAKLTDFVKMLIARGPTKWPICKPAASLSSVFMLLYLQADNCIDQTDEPLLFHNTKPVCLLRTSCKEALHLANRLCGSVHVGFFVKWHPGP